MRATKISLFIFCFLVGGLFWHYYPQLAIANGYAAKKLCTCVFVAGRDQAEVEKNSLYFSILGMVKNVIDPVKKEVSSTFLGMSRRTAVYRSGVGCILLDGQDDYHISFPSDREKGIAEMTDSTVKITNLIRSTAGTNQPDLKNAVEKAFDKGGLLTDKRTTAVIVFHNDTLVAEKYAAYFQRETPQLAWSMTKSLMNAFTGLMVLDNKLNIQQKDLFKNWSHDKRKEITLNDLLHMNSGLEWEEEYATVSDATKMLYLSEDISAIALDKPLVFKPGTHWYYSSGTTNLISQFLRNQIGQDSQYHLFLKSRLFDVLGMNSAFIETDEKGTFIGSSYGYATPMDWAKFGLLYLHDGEWGGKRILPEGWVNYTRQEAAGSEGKYGAHFWLNKGGTSFPDAPHDLFSANGFQGQYIFIIPSRNAVIVRMGTGDEGFDANLFLKEVLEALPHS